MNRSLSIIQIVISAILVGLILLQAKGTGLGSTFGGEIGFYATKRGAEKLLFILTIIVAVIFFAWSFLGVLI